MELLIGVGVSRASAATLVAEHKDRVEQAVAFVRYKQQEGRVKNPGGLVVDYLRHDDKYVLPDHMTRPPAAEVAQRAVVALQLAEQLAEREIDRERTRLASLSPTEQYEAVKPALKLLLKPLGKDLFAVFEERCRSGHLNALQERDLASVAMAELTMQDHLDALRTRLRGS